MQQRGQRGPRGRRGTNGVPGSGAVTRARFTGDGEVTAFTLPQSVPDALENGVLVYRNGLLCDRVTPPLTIDEYDVSGTEITFGVAPEEDDALTAVLYYSPVTRARFTGDDATTEFDLPEVVPEALENSLLVYRNGLLCDRVTPPLTIDEYDVSGDALTFGVAPETDDNLTVVVYY